MKNVKYHYEKACKLGIIEVEKLAREILKKHPELDEFIMAMGSYFFTLKNSDKTVSPYTQKMNNSWNYYSEDTFEYLKPLNDFISEWNSVLKITGEPMRFTVKGKIIKDW